MNEEQKYNSGAVTPYKATANLNTAIANPRVNINDTMNINIQNMATNTVMPNNTENTIAPSPIAPNNTQNIIVNKTISNNIQTNNVQNNIQSNNLNVQNNSAPYIPAKQNTLVADYTVSSSNINNSNNQNQTNNHPQGYVTKTYLTPENKPKKKKSILNLGSEFKVALLIIVILLVFVFMLPIISEMVFGY